MTMAIKLKPEQLTNGEITNQGPGTKGPEYTLQPVMSQPQWILRDDRRESQDHHHPTIIVGKRANMAYGGSTSLTATPSA